MTIGDFDFPAIYQVPQGSCPGIYSVEISSQWDSTLREVRGGSPLCHGHQGKCLF